MRIVFTTSSISASCPHVCMSMVATWYYRATLSTNLLTMQVLKRSIQKSARLPYHLPAVLQTRYNDWSILHWCTVAAVVLHHKVHRQTQFPASMPRHCLPERAVDNLRVVDDARNVVSAAHQTLVLARLPVDILGEDLHHVLLSIGRLVVAAMAVLWYVQRTVVMQ